MTRAGQPATANILTGLEIFESPNTSWEYNIDAAKQILDDAGWVMDGDTAVKRPVRVGASSINAVEIIDGVQEGDRIVVSGADQFGDAETISIN